MIVVGKPACVRVAASRRTRTSFVQALRTNMTTRGPLVRSEGRVTTGGRSAGCTRRTGDPPGPPSYTSPCAPASARSRQASACSGGASRIARQAAATRRGRPVDDDAEAVRRTIGDMPGRSLATTGIPAAMASNSLFGVVWRWLGSCPGWHHATSATRSTRAARPAGPAAGYARVRRGQRSLPGRGRPAPGGRSPSGRARCRRSTGSRPTAARCRGRARSRPGRGPLGRSEADRAPRGNAARAAVAAWNRNEQFITTSGPGTPNRSAMTSAYGWFTVMTRIGPTRPAPLGARDGHADGPTGARQVRGIHVDVARVIDDLRARRLAIGDRQGHGDAHVGHAVDEIDVRRDRHRAPRLRPNGQQDRPLADDAAGEAAHERP